MPRVIELIEDERGGWNIIVGDRMATWLGPDEALWTIAAILAGRPEAVRWLQTYETTMAWSEKYREKRVEPLALLEDLRVRGPAHLVRTGGAQVVRVRDDLGQHVNTFIRLIEAP